MEAFREESSHGVGKRGCEDTRCALHRSVVETLDFRGRGDFIKDSERGLLRISAKFTEDELYDRRRVPLECSSLSSKKFWNVYIYIYITRVLLSVNFVSVH